MEAAGGSKYEGADAAPRERERGRDKGDQPALFFACSFSSINSAASQAALASPPRPNSAKLVSCPLISCWRGFHLESSPPVRTDSL